MTFTTKSISYLDARMNGGETDTLVPEGPSGIWPCNRCCRPLIGPPFRCILCDGAACEAGHSRLVEWVLDVALSNPFVTMHWLTVELLQHFQVVVGLGWESQRHPCRPTEKPATAQGHIIDQAMLNVFSEGAFCACEIVEIGRIWEMAYRKAQRFITEVGVPVTNIGPDLQAGNFVFCETLKVLDALKALSPDESQDRETTNPIIYPARKAIQNSSELLEKLMMGTDPIWAGPDYIRARERLDDIQLHAERYFTAKSKGITATASDSAAKTGAEPRPEYDAINRVLNYKGKLLRKYTRIAERQMAVLEAFQTAGWPSLIEHSMGGSALDDTVTSLNSGLMDKLIRFKRRGATGVMWELVSPSEAQIDNSPLKPAIFGLSSGLVG